MGGACCHGTMRQLLPLGACGPEQLCHACCHACLACPSRASWMQPPSRPRRQLVKLTPDQPFQVIIFVNPTGPHGHGHQAARGNQPQHDGSHVSLAAWVGRSVVLCPKGMPPGGMPCCLPWQHGSRGSRQPGWAGGVGLSCLLLCMGQPYMWRMAWHGMVGRVMAWHGTSATWAALTRARAGVWAAWAGLFARRSSGLPPAVIS